MLIHQTISIETSGRGAADITEQLRQAVRAAGLTQGLLHVFIQHTSASLMVCENADPSVLADLETFFSRIAPDSTHGYRHANEGPDDMPAHIRTVLTQAQVTIPVIDSQLALGTWQGVFVYEHRLRRSRRSLVLTFHGAGT